MYTTQLLDKVKTPLVNKFYKLHGASGRANKQDQVWVIYLDEQIVAACRVQHKSNFLFYPRFMLLKNTAQKG
ncbi:hypothetical protein ATW7_12106 [Alteromonadales bacterium TW-7]|nr:hypothetical protein ATW7_12106 [Alteromonadales bacterium TW-7]